MKKVPTIPQKNKAPGKIGSEKMIPAENDLDVSVLGKQIKKLRLEQNLTQEQLGQRIGVQRAQISKMENNTGNVTISTILKIFGALNARVKIEIERGD